MASAIRSAFESYASQTVASATNPGKEKLVEVKCKGESKYRDILNSTARRG